MSTELTDGHFTTLSGIADHSISTAKAVIGKAFSFGYEKPTAFQVGVLEAELSFGGQDFFGTIPQLNQRTASITVGNPMIVPTSAALTVFASDPFDRITIVHWMFQ